MAFHQTEKCYHVKRLLFLMTWKMQASFCKRLMTNWLITAGRSFSLVLRYWGVIQLEILFQSTEETEIITTKPESLKLLLTMLMVEYKPALAII